MKSLILFCASVGILSMFFTGQTAQASAYKDMKQGVESYRQGNYDDSLSRFQQALVESPDDPTVRFNLASAQYQAGKIDEAARGFEAVVSQAKDPKLRQKALYNLGNTAFRQGNLKGSADYYRKALDLSPSDLEAKQNLEFVLKEQEKEKQNKGDQNKKENENNKEQQKSGRQNNQKDQNRDQQQSSKEKQQASPPQQKEKEQGREGSSQSSGGRDQQHKQGEIKEAGSGGGQKQGEKRDGSQAGAPLEPGAISPEEAERLLNTLSDDQRAFIRKQAKRAAPRTKGTAEDW
jgi:Ca-activated chloride channel family protein